MDQGTLAAGGGGFLHAIGFVGDFVGTIGRDPSVFKANRFHVDNFRFFSFTNKGRITLWTGGRGEFWA